MTIKTTLYSSAGTKKEEISLPEIFSSKIREDICAKLFEATKEIQPYAPFAEAGKRHSASGTISKRRHKWKGSYGKGISRVPRKKMWRRGNQFYWIAAEVSSVRGGRRAHPPKLIKKLKKINKNEIKLAIASAIASTANKQIILSRYSSLKEINPPYVIEELPSKTKDLIASLEKIFGSAFSIAMKNKKVRAGKGKARGRKYKSNAGLLIVIGKDEHAKFKGIDIVKSNELSISDLYPLGRLTIYTKKAIKDLEENKNVA
ncbi:MAG: 50S ribosomal protein L4 [Candidatus Pacearchaeota archaeon]|nr:50S ribosomal protein L4 [Candidatus Pacearchaeota archaeon]